MGQKFWARSCALAALAGATWAWAEPRGDDPFAMAAEGRAAQVGGGAGGGYGGEMGTGGADPEEGRGIMGGIDATGSGSRPAESPLAAEARRRIEAVLDQPLEHPLEVLEVPLNQVMQQIQETYDIPVVFDTAALDAAASSPEVEVTINIRSVSLRSALELMLKGVEDLTYVVDDEVLLITTKDEANKRLEIRFYRVDDLRGNEAEGFSPYVEDRGFQKLVDAIQATVEHDSWAANGTGEGEAVVLEPGVLIVTQTARVQEQIGEFLASLRATMHEVPASSAAVRQTPSGPVTASFALSDEYAKGSEHDRDTLCSAVVDAIRSTAGADGKPVSQDDFFVRATTQRLLVRQTPRVLRSVEAMLVSVGAIETPARSPRGSGLFGGGRGGGRGGGF